MSDLRILNRAVQYITSPSHEFTEAVREWIAAATNRMDEASRPRVAEWERRAEPAKVECPACKSPVDLLNEHARFNHDTEKWDYTCEPASEGAKVECPNCRESENYPHTGIAADGNRFGGWTCNRTLHDCPACCQPTPGDPLMSDHLCRKPAPPSEMPEAVSVAVSQMRAAHRMISGSRLASDILESADDLESFWRSQPAPALRMTPELERVLTAADLDAQHNEGRAFYGTAERTRKDIAAVRAQASQPAPAVAMTEELRNLLIFVDGTCSLRCDEGWRPETLEAMKKTADAVRAQASQPVKLEFSDAPVQAIRVLARHLSNCAQGSSVATTVVEVLHWIDAHEGRVTG